MEEPVSIEAAPTDSVRLVEQLSFERGWTVYFKNNSAPWEVEHFKNVFTIHTIADFWRFYNNVPNGMLGLYNMFMMANDVLPLWELNGNLFTRGGCWSVVIRSRGAWLAVMHELAMALVGEIKFSERVLGVCFVPVSENHIICKLWCTGHNDEDGQALANVMSQFSISAARFKGFV